MVVQPRTQPPSMECCVCGRPATITPDVEFTISGPTNIMVSEITPETRQQIDSIYGDLQRTAPRFSRAMEAARATPQAHELSPLFSPEARAIVRAAELQRHVRDTGLNPEFAEESLATYRRYEAAIDLENAVWGEEPFWDPCAPLTRRDDDEA